MEVMAKMLFDDKDFKKGIKNTERSTKTFSEKLKSGFKGLTKMAAKAAVGAAAAGGVAFVKLIKDSTQAYAEYEQLVGGVQKIFDEANITKIMEDANNAYKNLNMSASEYLATINQTGASFAQTMGDQKGYDVAKKGMQAIADYASGTGRNLEELNEKYSLITRSTSSYQSIADQFSGILPATSAAFLEQAQAAGYLSDSYTSLTEVPINEYQEAVTNMLEKGVKDMGLWGNTAAESTKTVTGSLAMMKAAWKNLVTGLSDPDADIGQLINNFVVSAEAAAKNLIPVIKNALTGVAQLITGLAPIIIAELPEIINVLTNEIPPLIMAIGQAILDNADALGQAAVGLFLALNDGLYQVLPVLIEAVPVLIHALIDGFIQNSDLMAKCGEDLIKGLVIGLINAAKVLVKNIYNDVVKPMIDAFKDALGIASPSKVMMEIGKDVILGLVKGIANKVKDIVKAVKNIAKTIKDKFLEVVQKAYEWGANLIERVKTGIQNKVNAVKQAVQKIAETIKAKMLEIVKNALAWGQNIISNFAAPLRNGIATIGGIAASIASTVVSKFSGIASSVRAKGADVSSAFAGGLKAGKTVIDKTVSSITTAVNKLASSNFNSYGWGRDLIVNMAEGIRRAMISNLSSAVANAASMIRSNLHHTHPEVGPLADDYTWMPDMMQLFAQGIRDNAHLITDAADDAFDLHDIVTGGVGSARVSTAIPSERRMLTFEDAVEAFKVALSEVVVELDDDEVGSFVRKTIVRAVPV